MEFSELADGFRHNDLDTCESTNRVCLEAARDGADGNLWITSAVQTAGRGSRGRNWASISGNLFASLLLIDPSDRVHLPELTFVAALSVHDAVSHFLPDSEIKLKWPNDILANGRKISGILLESSDTSNRTAVVVGIGINCVNHPEDTLYPATNLTSEGGQCDRASLFGRLNFAMAERIVEWQAGKGFQVLRQEWLGKAWGVGNNVEIHLYNGEIRSGIFEGLTSHGHMRLLAEDGSIEAISVGDVFPATGAKFGDTK